MNRFVRNPDSPVGFLITQTIFIPLSDGQFDLQKKAPVARIALAILIDAYTVLVNGYESVAKRTKVRNARKKDHQEAWDWIHDDRPWLFSFGNCCLLNGYAPSKVREAIIQASQHPDEALSLRDNVVRRRRELWSYREAA